MMATDRDALVCDLAEIYGIFDLTALPVPLLATLACGLRDHSRIKMRLSGSRLTRIEMLLAGAVDRLSLQLWQNSKDGMDGVNRPKSILAILLDEQDTANSDIECFDTAEDFEAEWARRTGVAHGW